MQRRGRLSQLLLLPLHLLMLLSSSLPMATVATVQTLNTGNSTKVQLNDVLHLARNLLLAGRLGESVRTLARFVHTEAFRDLTNDLGVNPPWWYHWDPAIDLKGALTGFASTIMRDKSLRVDKGDGEIDLLADFFFMSVVHTSPMDSQWFGDESGDHEYYFILSDLLSTQLYQVQQSEDDGSSVHLNILGKGSRPAGNLEVPRLDRARNQATVRLGHRMAELGLNAFPSGSGKLQVQEAKLRAYVHP